MFKISDFNLNTSDLLSIIAIIVSFCSIVFSYISIFFSKQIEIKYLKFENVGINGLDALMQPIDELFNNKTSLNKKVKDHLVIISEISTDIDLFLSEFKSWFEDFENQMNEIIIVKEEFTDLLFNNQEDSVKMYRSNYYILRSKIYLLFYEYAIKKDVSISNNFRLKIKKYWAPILFFLIIAFLIYKLIIRS